MLIVLIILIVTVVFISSFYAYYYFSGRAAKKRLIANLEQLAATTQMENSQLQSVASPALSGRYRAHDFYVEAAQKRSGTKKMDFWRISAEQEIDVADRFYIQGEKREGKLRKVVGLDVITTGDELFDQRVLVFASDKSLARRIFGPYMRERFLWLALNDFAIELDGRSCVMEIYLSPPTSVRSIRHSMEVMTELMNVIRTVAV
jgi:hypothetical protein